MSRRERHTAEREWRETRHTYTPRRIKLARKRPWWKLF